MQRNSVGKKCSHKLSPFQCDKSNSKKSLSRKKRRNDNSYTNMTNTTLVSSSVRDVNAIPTAADTNARFTGRSSRKQTPLVQNGKLLLADWKVKRNPLRCMAYQAIQPSLYPSHKDRGLLQVANHPGICELADVLGKKLIHFVQV